MAPASSTGPTKHIALPSFMIKRQHLLRQRLKPTVLWTSWPPAAEALDEAAMAADGMGGAWPPRSYTCAFCRREFRSAQALGGHMNVHRRDRAKMRSLQYGAAVQLGMACTASAAGATTATEYRVFMPSGNVLLSAPVALAVAAHDRRHCHEISNADSDNEIDLELRLGWP